MKKRILELKENILELLNLIFLKIKVKLAIKMADYKHYISNKCYYVIPFTDGGLMVVCNKDIKLKKKQGLIDKNDNHLDISEKALYWTAIYRGKSLDLDERIKMAKNYQKWLKVASKLKIGNPVATNKKKQFIPGIN